MEVSNYSDGKLNYNQSGLNDKSKKLSSIPEIVNEEQSSSLIDFKETNSKTRFMELMGSAHQNGAKMINKISSNGIISSIFCCQCKNIHQETNCNYITNNFSENKIMQIM